MSENQIALSIHIQRLIDEKFTISIEGNFIIVDNIPYVSAVGVVSRGAIISPYENHNGTESFGDHTVWFTGSVPCASDGTPLTNTMIADTSRTIVANREVQCRFSYKSERPETMANIYNKLTHNIRKLQSYANVIDPNVSASGGNGGITVRQERSVFHYPNSAISRAGLEAYEKKLKLNKVAIIGLGGTGSYILDVLAKTPVNEILLYDDDLIDPATAYRMPGAISVDEAQRKMLKTDYLCEVYSRLRIGIKSFPKRIDVTNVNELNDCEFVFIAVDHGPSRGIIAHHLAEKEIAFIDVGIGVDKVTEDFKLVGRGRVTYVDKNSKSNLSNLPVADDKEEAVYNNIQLAELNALNAMLAVTLYKQKLGFYSEEPAADELKYKLAWQKITRSPEASG